MGSYPIHSDHAEQISDFSLPPFLGLGEVRGYIPKSSLSDLHSKMTGLL